MAEEKQSVTVEIYGTPYKIRAGAETAANHIQMVASEVDAQMKKIANASPRLDLPRLAVLAAVNVADQMYRLRGDLDKHMIKNEINQSQVKEELAVLRKQYAELQERNEELEKEAAQHAERERDHQAKLSEAQQALGEVRGQLEQLRKANERNQQGESEQQIAYRKLKEDYEKLQNEYNEWIQLAEGHQPGHQ